jgi:hypothetical protein
MFIDTFHATKAEALVEAARRRADPMGGDLLTFIRKRPTGGYRVHSVFADVWVDQLADGLEGSKDGTDPRLRTL